MAEGKPSWRKIEAALIELLREEGFDLEQVGGITTVDVWSDPDSSSIQIDLSDFAQALADRL